MRIGNDLHNPLMAYRPDIDGLRAVAVLSVVAFHLNETLLPGGFLGVDVFFVISGYLITLLLLKSFEQGAAGTLIHFYRRRVQRIVPALLFMILAILPAGFVLMAPDDFRDLLWSSIASLLSLANVYFHVTLDSGYFAAETDAVPLLHVWSLGVEEQFYLVWPVLLVALVRCRWRVRMLWVSSGIAGSLALAQFLAAADPSFIYYMLPARAWELLAGALAALLAARGWSIRGRWGHVIGLAGLALVVAGLAVVDDAHVIPGLPVVPVILGTSLLVLSPPDGLAGRLLSLRPMVAVGLVSYSAYLWHWPILAYLRYALVEITWPVAGAVVLATFALATVSYRFVERPFRRLRLPTAHVFVRYLGVPVAALVLVGGPMIHAINTRGWDLYPWERYDRLDETTKAATDYDFNCQYSRFEERAFSDPRCVFPPDSEPTVLLLGDSQAAQYLGLLRVWAEELGFSLRNATQSACPLLVGHEVDWVHPSFAEGCTIYNGLVERQLADYRTVLIGGSWRYYRRVGGREFHSMLKDSLARIAARVPDVIILAQTPSFPEYQRDCPIRQVRLPGTDCVARAEAAGRDESTNRYLRELAGGFDNVHVLDIRHALCRSGACSPYLNDDPVYFDSGHISMAGSRAIGAWLLNRQDPAVRAFGAIVTGRPSAAGLSAAPSRGSRAASDPLVQ